MDLATETPLAPVATATRSEMPMSDAEFDSLLGSAEFQDLLGPPGAAGGAAAGAGDLVEPLAGEYGWAGDKSLDAFLRAGSGDAGSPSAGLCAGSGDDLASAPPPTPDLMQLDGPLPAAEAAPNPSYTSGATPSGGPPSGCCTPAATSEAGARFEDAALSPPTEAGVRAPADTGGTSSQSESVQPSRQASPGIVSGAGGGWPANAAPSAPQMVLPAGLVPPLAPHMQHQPPHLMPTGAMAGAPFGYSGLQYGGMQYGGGMPVPMGTTANGLTPAMNGSGSGMFGVGPMEWGATAAPLQAQQQAWPAVGDQPGMWGTQPGGGYSMQPSGNMLGGNVFGQPFGGGLQKPALRSVSEVWSSDGSGQSSQSGFQHPALGGGMASIGMQQQQQHQLQGSSQQQQEQQQHLTIQSYDQRQMQLSPALQPETAEQQQQQHSQSATRPQRLRTARRIAHRSSHDASPQLKASSAQDMQPTLSGSEAFMQQTQAGAQQQAATGLPGSFYAAPHNVSCMPAQMPGATPAACSGPPGAVPASMTGLPAGGIMSTGAAGLLPMSAPCFAGGPQGSMQAGAAGPHAMRPSRISLQPRSPAFQQHSAPGALLATTPRTAGKRSSASFGELGGLSPRGGGSKARGAYSQPGTPRSEALVLEELKALIGQLDPATKATMKNSLYRISRNAAGGGATNDRGLAAEAAAQAAKEPNSRDDVGPVDRLVADLLYKEPLQQAPNLPQQLAETARVQTAAAEERWG